MQRRLSQVLLVGRLQHLIGNVTGARHGEHTVVHGYGSDYGQQAVGLGALLGIARLQWRQCRQELALTIHEAQHVGHVGQRQTPVKGFGLVGPFISFGLAPYQAFTRSVERQVWQRPPA
ncbi:hypothetical protein ALO43_200240 [Pseudomonas tremae]|uniref:Uncharacterized protein n=1 Tax=Pseudomonas tremae TaxID=200454 RepID=A0AA40TU26_9PSED|nr:hypothetical protein ALO43_200240 [Pseudomonas tremae]